MKKKICIFIIMVVFTFVGLKTINASTLTKTDYLNQIEELEKDIDNLKKKIDEINLKINKLNEEYNQLSSVLAGKITQEDMFDWFNYCDIYNTRACVRIQSKFYKTFLGIETSSATRTGSGVIIKKEKDSEYVLTSSYIVKNDTKYDKVKYTVWDAFKYEYSGILYCSNESYGLAILKFNKKSNDLYAVSLASNDVALNDPVCNIYSPSGYGYNHMNFSTISNTSRKGDDFSFSLIVNEIYVKSNIYGSMTVNMKGQLVGLTYYSQTSSDYQTNYSIAIPVSIIKVFLSQNGIAL